jgi:hypothetical protein
MKPIIRKRGCPASYGVVWNMPFDEKDHAEIKSEAIKMKPDGHLYLPSRIQWFIKQHDLLDCDRVLEFPLSQSVHRKNPAILRHEIVRYDGRPINLPDKVAGDAVRSVCTFSGSLQGGKELRKVKGVQEEHKIKIPVIGGFGKFLRVEYKIRVEVEDAGLKFGIRFNGEDIGHAGEIETEWDREFGGFEAQRRNSDAETMGDSSSDPPSLGPGTAPAGRS